MPSDRHTQSLRTSTGPNQSMCHVLPSRPKKLDILLDRHSAGERGNCAVIAYCFRSRFTTGVWKFSGPDSNVFCVRTIDFGGPFFGRKLGYFVGSAFSRQAWELRRDCILLQIKVHDGCVEVFRARFERFLRAHN